MISQRGKLYVDDDVGDYSEDKDQTNDADRALSTFGMCMAVLDDGQVSVLLFCAEVSGDNGATAACNVAWTTLTN